MSEEEVPRLSTSKALAEYIESLVEGIQWGEPEDHPGSALSLGYEQSANALWKAALAAFEYVAAKAGVSGFQASWAALHFYGKAMGIDGPFGVVRAHDALYPQYDVPAKVQGWLDEDWAEWLRDQAREMLKYHDGAATEVRAHWERLANSE